jgi:hypothetical protein
MNTYNFDDVSVDAEDLVDGILINPALPEDFDNTPNDERSHKETAFWWNRPFILTDTLDLKSYDDYIARARENADPELGFIWVEREEWNADQMLHKRNWLHHFPSGTRYMVRCLDGGAWDRSTNWGVFPTLDLALNCVRGGPAYIQGLTDDEKMKKAKLKALLTPGVEA